VSLHRQAILEEVASLWLSDPLSEVLTATQLDGVDLVGLLGLDLGDLAPVNLDHSTRHKFTPFVPEMGAADFGANEANPLRLSVNRLGGLDLKL